MPVSTPKQQVHPAANVSAGLSPTAADQLFEAMTVTQLKLTEEFTEMVAKSGGDVMRSRGKAVSPVGISDSIGQ